MAEVSTINQVVQIGVETIEGTAVPALKKLSSISYDIGSETNIDVFKGKGRKRPSVASMSQEWASGDLSGRPTYDEFIYPLAQIWGNQVITSLGSGAYQHDFTPRTSGADDVKSLTIQQGDPFSGLAHQSSGVKLQALALAISRAATELTGTVIGKRLVESTRLSGNEIQQLAISGGTPTSGTALLTFNGQTTAGVAYNTTAAALQTALEALSNINPGDVICAGGPWPATPITVEFSGQYAQSNVAAITATDTFDGAADVAITTTTPGTPPTELPETPIQATEWSVYLDTTQAGLGTTKGTRVISANMGDADRFGPVWVVDQAQDSYVATVETDPTSDTNFMLEADATARAFYPRMRAGASVWVRLEAVGPIIAGGINYRARFDFNMKITGANRFEDADGVYAIRFNGQLFHDSSWGKSVTARVVNTQAGL